MTLDDYDVNPVPGSVEAEQEDPYVSTRFHLVEGPGCVSVESESGVRIALFEDRPQLGLSAEQMAEIFMDAMFGPGEEEDPEDGLPEEGEQSIPMNQGQAGLPPRTLDPIRETPLPEDELEGEQDEEEARSRTVAFPGASLAAVTPAVRGLATAPSATVLFALLKAEARSGRGGTPLP
jgi:hypothetical protein